MLQVPQWAPSGSSSRLPTTDLAMRQRGHSRSQRSSRRPARVASRQSSDQLARRPAPGLGQAQGPDLGQVDLLGRRQMIGQALGEAVTVARGLDAGDPLGQACARIRRQVRCLVVEGRFAPAGSAIAGIFGERREVAPGGLEEAAAQDRAAQQIGGRGGDGVGALRTAVVARRQLELGTEPLQRPRAKGAAMLEPALGDPVDRNLLPEERDRPLAGARRVAHRAVGPRRLLDRVQRQFGSLVEAGRVGEQRPDLGRRAVEAPMPAAGDRLAHVPLRAPNVLPLKLT